MVTYLSYYPHYTGTLAGKMHLDDTLFCLLLAMTKDPEPNKPDEYTHLEELLDMIEFGLEENRELSPSDLELYNKLIQFEGDEVYSFEVILGGSWDNMDATKQPARILRHFAQKGFFVAEWEEGTHALALPGYVKQAVDEIARCEAKHVQDETSHYF